MKKNEIPVAQNNDFDGLVAHIQQTQDVLQNNARLVINRHVTAKAWLTGYYIVEYEQKGADRAKYGEQLLKKLAEKLKDKKTFSYRSLNIYRKFYLAYPALNDQIMHFVLSLPSIVQTVSAQFQQSVLVFYHRILKRHVIIELKANRLNYADAAQLHMYLAYYRKNIMQPDDNPPIGILLCSEVGQEMAEYSLLDLDESVFISKYQLNVPSKERMTEFLCKENEGIYNKV